MSGRAYFWSRVRAVVYVTGLCLIGLTRNAHAELLTLGAGANLFGGVAWLPQPEPSGFTLLRTQRGGDIPSLIGAAYGGGVTLEPRFMDTLGLELDGFLARDFISGDVKVGASKTPLNIGQVAVHISTLLKVRLETGPFDFTAALGPEWVIPMLPRAEATNSTFTAIASADSYTALTFALGGEANVKVPGFDVRWPLQVRLSYVPSVGSALSERVTALPSDTVIFESVPQYQVSLVTGLLNFW